MNIATTYGRAAAITPNDSVELPAHTRAIYVGGAGTLIVDMSDDAAANITFLAVPAGTTLPLRVRRVHATGTTATSLVALY